jgi:hypothetical protein
MANSLPPAPALVISRSAIVNKDGTASWEFVKILQNWALQINNSLNAIGQFIGTLSPNATVGGRSGTLGAALQNIDSTGILQPPGITPATPLAQGGVILPTGASSNLLGTAALQPTTAFDPAGAAATAQTNAETFATAAANTAQSNAETFASNASNITSGNLALAQLPTAGITHTSPLAKLTTLGTNGSLTFTNGILTAAVDPT